MTQRRLRFLCGADVAKALPLKEAVGAYRPTVHEVPGEGRGRSS